MQNMKKVLSLVATFVMAMMILPTEIKLCCKMLGMATIDILPSSFHEKTSAFSVVLILVRCKNTTTTASMQLIPWQIKVAHATPATPILNAVTNSMSIPILESDEQARKTNGVFESPSAEKIPVAIL